MHVSEQVLEMAALGRPFQLGMLYDCRSDFLLPGITLWDPGTLAKNIDMRVQPNTETQVIAFDTLANKAGAFSLSSSLKASFLGSLVRVEGSAKFLNDRQRSQRQARVTLKYSASTHFKQLTMSQIGRQHVSYPEVFEQSVATHVVTGILYGAHAFFVFDQMSSSVESVQDVQAKLHAMVMKIPTAAVAGEGGISGQRDARGKDVAGSFSCSFYGDFALESNPTTYEEALRVYSSLPQRLGSNGEKAVPVKLWLYPLIRLHSRAAKLVREVSAKLVSDTERALEKLMEVDVRCNDLLQDPISTTFPEILKKIRAFKHLCEQYKCAFQKRLAQVLPSIRGGGAEEVALVDILRGNEQSPFRTSLLKKFLDLRYREIYFVKFFLDLSKGRVSSQDDLVRRVLDPRIDAVVAFIFTSLEAKEPYLHTLSASLAHGSEPKPKALTEADKKFTPWFEDKDVLESARNAAMVFADFSLSCYPGEVRFVVTSRRDDGNPGAVLVRYQSGCLDGTRLDLLPRPSPPLIDAISYDRFELTFKPAEAGTQAVSGYYVQYRVFGEE
ncbi:verrucotoxin subunit beta-like [Varanus komodoensis]|uniref:verrucotoxin subunit beta-like n=1 Tax=Varanus komodoensis TaxID=61221 RepID=UPI001CF7CCE1|nr:verrucotoxin subunit beta-like [Varanus komodoensis]